MEFIKVKAQVASTEFDQTNERFTPEALADIAAQAEGKDVFWAFDYERSCGKILAAELADERVTVEAELHGTQAIALARMCDKTERDEGKSAGFIVPGFRVLESENEIGDVVRPFIRTIKRLHLVAFGLVPEPSDQSLESLRPMPTAFIQSCEHGKLSGQHCFICKRLVPYGPTPE